MDAWSRCSGQQLDAWEWRALAAMDRALMAQLSGRTEPTAPSGRDVLGLMRSLGAATTVGKSVKGMTARE